MTLLFPARFRIEHDELGWRIGIADVAYCRPDHRGRITTWTHDPAISPEDVRPDIELLRAVIKRIADRAERRRLFAHPHGDRFEKALEVVIDIANEAVAEGRIADWTGNDEHNRRTVAPYDQKRRGMVN